MNYEILGQGEGKVHLRFTFEDGLIYERSINQAIRDDLSIDNELTEKYIEDVSKAIRYKRMIGAITAWELENEPEEDE